MVIEAFEQLSPRLRRLIHMHSVWSDVRYAARGLRKQPAFAALAILALALGIGSATTMFSVIENVLIDPYPFPNVDRFIGVQIRDRASTRPGGRIEGALLALAGTRSGSGWRWGPSAPTSCAWCSGWARVSSASAWPSASS